MKIITLFANKGGVGKTTLTYNLAFMLEKMGKRVLIADLDPQANLTSLSIDDEIITKAINNQNNHHTIYYAIEPLVKGLGDFRFFEPYKLPRRKIWIYMGDVLLSKFESIVSENWLQVFGGQERQFRGLSSIYRLIEKFSRENNIDIILVDLAPNIGSLNKTFFLYSDYFITPLIPDLFSLRGLEHLGPTITEWVDQWERARRGLETDIDFKIFSGRPQYLGYILQQFNIYIDSGLRNFGENG